MSLIPTAIELLNCAQETIDALKAEVEQYKKAAHEWEMNCAEARADLAKERERAERLRGALESIAFNSKPEADKIEFWEMKYSLDEVAEIAAEDVKVARKALLAAKRDEGDG